MGRTPATRIDSAPDRGLTICEESCKYLQQLENRIPVAMHAR